MTQTNKLFLFELVRSKQAGTFTKMNQAFHRERGALGGLSRIHFFAHSVVDQCTIQHDMKLYQFDMLRQYLLEKVECYWKSYTNMSEKKNCGMVTLLKYVGKLLVASLLLLFAVHPWKT